MPCRGLTNHLYGNYYVILIKLTMECYELNDFKTGKNFKTPAKRKLWGIVIEEKWGSIGQLEKKYHETLSEGGSKAWNSTHINGMSAIIDDLTGNRYGVNSQAVKTIAGTLAQQFKLNTMAIIRYLKDSKNSAPIEQLLNEPKVVKVPSKLSKSDFIKQTITSLQSFEQKDRKNILTALNAVF